MDLSQGPYMGVIEVLLREDGTASPDRSDASYQWSIDSEHKMQHGSVLSIPNVPTYPSEDACTDPAEADVLPQPSITIQEDGSL
jgi:hypothetical protein